jgi:hypothetical protein
MRKLLLSLAAVGFLGTSAFAGIQPKLDSYLIQWERISQHLEAKKTTLPPAMYKKYSSELMASRVRMSDNTSRMDREKYYGFAEGELKKIEQIDAQIK